MRGHGWDGRLGVHRWGGRSNPRLRVDACAGLGFLGVRLDVSASQFDEGDRLISPDGANPVLVVHAREDLEIARHVRELLE